MLNKWKCRKCHRITTEYQTICEHYDCDSERGLWRWLWNVDNPFLWAIGLLGSAGIVFIILMALGGK